MNSTLCARQYALLSGVSKPLADSISCSLYLQPCRVATPNCVCINFNHETHCARVDFTSSCLWSDAVSLSDLVITFQRIINTFDFMVKPSSWNVSWWSGWYKDPSKLPELLAQKHTFNISVVRALISRGLMIAYAVLNPSGSRWIPGLTVAAVGILTTRFKWQHKC